MKRNILVAFCMVIPPSCPVAGTFEWFRFDRFTKDLGRLAHPALVEAGSGGDGSLRVALSGGCRCCGRHTVAYGVGSSPT